MLVFVAVHWAGGATLVAGCGLRITMAVLAEKGVQASLVAVHGLSSCGA